MAARIPKATETIAALVVRYHGDPVVVRFTVPGPVPRKNARTRTRIAGTGRKAFVQYYPSADWKDWISRLSSAVYGIEAVRAGAWAIRIRTYTDMLRHLDDGDLHVALGDVDSPISAVLDGLQNEAVGVLDDDARFVEEHVTKHFDKTNPRTEIELVRVDPDQPQQEPLFKC